METHVVAAFGQLVYCEAFDVRGHQDHNPPVTVEKLNYVYYSDHSEVFCVLVDEFEVLVYYFYLVEGGNPEDLYVESVSGIIVADKGTFGVCEAVSYVVFLVGEGVWDFYWAGEGDDVFGSS